MTSHTGTLGWIMGAAIACAMPHGGAVAGCTLAKIAEFPVTMIDSRPTLIAQINGAPARFIADSGAFYSMMSAAGAAEFNLKTFPAPWSLSVKGVGGTAGGLQATDVKEFKLAGVPIHNVEFLVGGSEVGSSSIGLLGQNVFRVGDVEYDLAGGVIRLMREAGCGKANLAYWAAGKDMAFSEMAIDATTGLAPHTTGVALLNGAKIRVIFDTGAATSVLSERAAARAGVKPDSSGAVDAGYFRGIGRGTVKTWIAPFASFKLGDEEIRNTRLRVANLDLDSDMLIGADFFLSHRVYVASKQQRLFFTYNGGPVFNLTKINREPPAAADTDAPKAVSPGEPKADSPDATKADSPDAPKDAAGYSRRGNALAARRDFEHAIADLTRACELAPDQPDYFYQRGMVQLAVNKAGAALADFDQAILLKPDHVPALVARAALRIGASDAAKAIEDLDAASAAAPREADERFAMAFDYARVDRLPQALTQLDWWIPLHENDVRLGNALVERCWSRMQLGQDLPKALDDCNGALKRADKTPAARERCLAGRGLVRLRLGDYDKSIKDFDAALGSNPKNAFALYGRGIAKSRLGQGAGSQADLAAAAAVWPDVAKSFAKRGMVP